MNKLAPIRLFLLFMSIGEILTNIIRLNMEGLEMSYFCLEELFRAEKVEWAPRTSKVRYEGYFNFLVGFATVTMIIVLILS